jgi:hypothetical protein
VVTPAVVTPASSGGIHSALNVVVAVVVVPPSSTPNRHFSLTSHFGALQINNLADVL